MAKKKARQTTTLDPAQWGTHAWGYCLACRRFALPQQLRETLTGLMHSPDCGGCDEPQYQRCTGCSQPVHLNHVEYTGKTMEPWCASCVPEEGRV